MARPRTVPGSRLTRAQVAKRLGVHKSTVARMEGVHLHPLIDEHGVRYFDVGRVEELAARCEGENVLTLELEPEQHQRAKALCTAAGTTLPAWIREQIATLLAG